jgi:hypothetical protein
MQAKLYSSGRARGLSYDPRDICILAFALHVSHLDCYLPSERAGAVRSLKVFSPANARLQSPLQS